jgi:hypothetical protein
MSFDKLLCDLMEYAKALGAENPEGFVIAVIEGKE